MGSAGSIPEVLPTVSSHRRFLKFIASLPSLEPSQPEFNLNASKREDEHVAASVAERIRRTVSVIQILAQTVLVVAHPIVDEATKDVLVTPLQRRNAVRDILTSKAFCEGMVFLSNRVLEENTTAVKGAAPSSTRKVEDWGKEEQVVLRSRTASLKYLRHEASSSGVTLEQRVIQEGPTHRCGTDSCCGSIGLSLSREFLQCLSLLVSDFDLLLLLAEPPPPILRDASFRLKPGDGDGNGGVRLPQASHDERIAMLMQCLAATSYMYQSPPAGSPPTTSATSNGGGTSPNWAPYVLAVADALRRSTGALPPVVCLSTKTALATIVGRFWEQASSCASRNNDGGGATLENHRTWIALSQWILDMVDCGPGPCDTETQRTCLRVFRALLPAIDGVLSHCDATASCDSCVAEQFAEVQNFCQMLEAMDRCGATDLLLLQQENDTVEAIGAGNVEHEDGFLRQYVAVVCRIAMLVSSNVCTTSIARCILRVLESSDDVEDVLFEARCSAESVDHRHTVLWQALRYLSRIATSSTAVSATARLFTAFVEEGWVAEVSNPVEATSETIATVLELGASRCRDVDAMNAIFRCLASVVCPPQTEPILVVADEDRSLPAPSALATQSCALDAHAAAHLGECVVYAMQAIVACVDDDAAANDVGEPRGNNSGGVTDGRAGVARTLVHVVLRVLHRFVCHSSTLAANLALVVDVVSSPIPSASCCCGVRSNFCDALMELIPPFVCDDRGAIEWFSTMSALGSVVTRTDQLRSQHALAVVLDVTRACCTSSPSGTWACRLLRALLLTTAASGSISHGDPVEHSDGANALIHVLLQLSLLVSIPEESGTNTSKRRRHLSIWDDDVDRTPMSVWLSCVLALATSTLWTTRYDEATTHLLQVELLKQMLSLAPAATHATTTNIVATAHSGTGGRQRPPAAAQSLAAEWMESFVSLLQAAPEAAGVALIQATPVSRWYRLFTKQLVVAVHRHHQTRRSSSRMPPVVVVLDRTDDVVNRGGGERSSSSSSGSTIVTASEARWVFALLDVVFAVTLRGSAAEGLSLLVGPAVAFARSLVTFHRRTTDASSIHATAAAGAPEADRKGAMGTSVVTTMCDVLLACSRALSIGVVDGGSSSSSTPEICWRVLSLFAEASSRDLCRVVVPLLVHPPGHCGNPLQGSPRRWHSSRSFDGSHQRPPVVGLAPQTPAASLWYLRTVRALLLPIVGAWDAVQSVAIDASELDNTAVVVAGPHSARRGTRVVAACVEGVLNTMMCLCAHNISDEETDPAANLGRASCDSSRGQPPCDLIDSMAHLHELFACWTNMIHAFANGGAAEMEEQAAAASGAQSELLTTSRRVVVDAEPSTQGGACDKTQVVIAAAEAADVRTMLTHKDVRVAVYNAAVRVLSAQQVWLREGRDANREEVGRESERDRCRDDDVHRAAEWFGRAMVAALRIGMPMLHTVDTQPLAALLNGFIDIAAAGGKGALCETSCMWLCRCVASATTARSPSGTSNTHAEAGLLPSLHGAAQIAILQSVVELCGAIFVSEDALVWGATPMALLLETIGQDDASQLDEHSTTTKRETYASGDERLLHAILTQWVRLCRQCQSDEGAYWLSRWLYALLLLDDVLARTGARRGAGPSTVWLTVRWFLVVPSTVKRQSHPAFGLPITEADTADMWLRAMYTAVVAERRWLLHQHHRTHLPVHPPGIGGPLVFASTLFRDALVAMVVPWIRSAEGAHLFATLVLLVTSAPFEAAATEPIDQVKEQQQQQLYWYCNYAVRDAFEAVGRVAVATADDDAIQSWCTTVGFLVNACDEEASKGRRGWQHHDREVDGDGEALGGDHTSVRSRPPSNAAAAPGDEFQLPLGARHYFGTTAIRNVLEHMMQHTRTAETARSLCTCVLALLGEGSAPLSSSSGGRSAGGVDADEAGLRQMLSNLLWVPSFAIAVCALAHRVATNALQILRSAEGGGESSAAVEAEADDVVNEAIEGVAHVLHRTIAALTSGGDSTSTGGEATKVPVAPVESPLTCAMASVAMLAKAARTPSGAVHVSRCIVVALTSTMTPHSAATGGWLQVLNRDASVTAAFVAMAMRCVTTPSAATWTCGAMAKMCDAPMALAQLRHPTLRVPQMLVRIAEYCDDAVSARWWFTVLSRMVPLANGPIAPGAMTGGIDAGDCVAALVSEPHLMDEVCRLLGTLAASAEAVASGSLAIANLCIGVQRENTTRGVVRDVIEMRSLAARLCTPKVVAAVVSAAETIATSSTCIDATVTSVLDAIAALFALRNAVNATTHCSASSSDTGMVAMEATASLREAVVALLAPSCTSQTSTDALRRCMCALNQTQGDTSLVMSTDASFDAFLSAMLPSGPSSSSPCDDHRKPFGDSCRGVARKIVAVSDEEDPSCSLHPPVVDLGDDVYTICNAVRSIAMHCNDVAMLYDDPRFFRLWREMAANIGSLVRPAARRDGGSTCLRQLDKATCALCEALEWGCKRNVHLAERLFGGAADADKCTGMPSALHALLSNVFSAMSAPTAAAACRAMEAASLTSTAAAAQLRSPRYRDLLAKVLAPIAATALDTSSCIAWARAVYRLTTSNDADGAAAAARYNDVFATPVLRDALLYLCPPMAAFAVDDVASVMWKCAVLMHLTATDAHAAVFQTVGIRDWLLLVACPTVASAASRDVVGDAVGPSRDAIQCLCGAVANLTLREEGRRLFLTFVASGDRDVFYFLGLLAPAASSTSESARWHLAALCNLTAWSALTASTGQRWLSSSSSCAAVRRILCQVARGVVDDGGARLLSTAYRQIYVTATSSVDDVSALRASGNDGATERRSGGGAYTDDVRALCGVVQCIDTPSTTAAFFRALLALPTAALIDDEGQRRLSRTRVDASELSASNLNDIASTVVAEEGAKAATVGGATVVEAVCGAIVALAPLAGQLEDAAAALALTTLRVVISWQADTTTAMSPRKRMARQRIRQALGNIVAAVAASQIDAGVSTTTTDTLHNALSVVSSSGTW